MPAWRSAPFTARCTTELVQVMAAALTRDAIDIHPRSREKPLPGPFAPGVRIFPSQRHRKLDPAGAAPQVLLVLPTCGVEMPEQSRADHCRQHRHTVFGAVAAADDDLAAGEVDVLDA